MAIKSAIHGIVAGAMLFAAGCASDPDKPIIDPEGVDMARFEADRAKCEEVALQVEQKAANQAVTGAVVLGLIGAIFGDRETVQNMAAAGFISGGAEGLKDTDLERSKVVRNCLRARGYNVLN